MIFTREIRPFPKRCSLEKDLRAGLLEGASQTEAFARPDPATGEPAGAAAVGSLHPTRKPIDPPRLAGPVGAPPGPRLT